jgi:hypothetical protein
MNLKFSYLPFILLALVSCTESSQIDSYIIASSLIVYEENDIIDSYVFNEKQIHSISAMRKLNNKLSQKDSLYEMLRINYSDRNYSCFISIKDSFFAKNEHEENLKVKIGLVANGKELFDLFSSNRHQYDEMLTVNYVKLKLYLMQYMPINCGFDRLELETIDVGADSFEVGLCLSSTLENFLICDSLYVDGNLLLDTKHVTYASRFYQPTNMIFNKNDKVSFNFNIKSSEGVRTFPFSNSKL